MRLSDLSANLKIMVAIAIIAVISLLGSLWGGGKLIELNDTYAGIIAQQEAGKLINARAARLLATYGRDVYSLVMEQRMRAMPG